MSHEEYVGKVKQINQNIYVVEKYINTKTKILHRCKIDNYEWPASPEKILNGCGCPNCNRSKGEKMVRLWLGNNKILYTPQKKFDDCVDKRQLPFDFYLDDYNICIEYQGMQHYEPIEYFGGGKALAYTQYHDKLKSNYCESSGIPLICIPYWEKVDQYLNENLLILIQ